MLRFAAVALLAFGAGAMVGCNGQYNGARAARHNELQAKFTGNNAVVYQEIPRDDKIYVVGTKKGADAVNAGKKLPMAVKAFGYGPKGETVVFEQNKDGIEELLMPMYDERHGKKQR